MKKILLVEDNLLCQKIEKAILESLGFSVEVAENGLEALDLIQKDSFDAILMDMEMPRMTGIECAKLLKSVREWKSIPIIALTSNAHLTDKEACLAAGMNDFMTKPLNRQEIRQKILALTAPSSLRMLL